MKVSILPQILQMEEHFNQYEKLGGKLSGDLRSAILLRVITGPIKIHLNVTLNEGSSYQKIREAVLAYDTASTRWNEFAALSFSSNTSPMQLGFDSGGQGTFQKRLAQFEGAECLWSSRVAGEETRSGVLQYGWSGGAADAAIGENSV